MFLGPGRGMFVRPAADITNSVLTRTSAATVINKIMRLIGATSSCGSRPHDGAFVHNGSQRGQTAQPLLTNLLVLCLLLEAGR